MKSKHITKILDKTKFAELSEADKTVISTHCADCADCRRAFDAARLSEVLLKAEAVVEVPAPSAFFQAKVMNAWRKRQHLPRRQVEAFRRWWQASAVPVFMMLAVLGVLTSLTFLAPQSSADDSTAEVNNFRLYTTESVVLNQSAPKNITNEQLFQLIYTPRNDTRK